MQDSFRGELPFCFKKGDGRDEAGAMRSPGREVGNSFADHAIGEDGSSHLHEGGAFFDGEVGVKENAHFDGDTPW